MAQTIILAAGTTAATSTDVVLATGINAQISIYTVTSGQMPPNANLELRIDTNGADAVVANLNYQNQSVHLVGPGTYRVFRPPQTVQIGVTSEV